MNFCNRITLSVANVGMFFKGASIARDDANSGNIPAVRYGELYTDYDTFIIGQTHSNISEQVATGAFELQYGDILFAGSGETVEDIGKSAVFLLEKGYAGGDIIVLRPSPEIINSKFIAYYFETELWKKQRRKMAQGQSIVHIHVADLKKMKINLPELETQEKIVVILEKWDAAIENLKRQILEEEKILKSLCKNVFVSGIFAEVKLADIAVLYQPKTIAESELQLSGYPVYGANGLIGYYDKYNHESSQIVITCRGSTCGTVNLVPGFSWITGNAMVVNIDDNENINQKYLYYFLKNINFKPFISGSGQPQIVKTSLSKMKIKVPDLKEQLKIALILDAQDQRLSLLRQKLANYEKQRKYLLNRLLSGKEDI